MAILGHLLLGVTACGGLGVEQYRQVPPAVTLELRFVAAADTAAAERVPRFRDEADFALLAPGAVLRAAHVAQVQLLEAGDGERLLVLQLREEGRARLREATANATGRQLALVVDGRVIATPSIRGTLDESEIAIRVAPSVIDAAFLALSE